MCKKILFGVLILIMIMPFSATATSLMIGVNFLGNNAGESGFVPPDMGFAVGPAALVQLNNGVYQVFSKSGATLAGPITDVQFWANAGQNITNGGSSFASDPRVSYDPNSGRFFASEINFNTANPDTTPNNQAFIAVSNTSNPLDGWKALSFTIPGGVNELGDFDTLGLDKNGVYIGTNNFTTFGSQGDISVYSIPKADLLAGTPTLANMTSFTGLSGGFYGAVPQPALDTGGTHGQIMGIGPNLNQVALYNISGSGGPGATISSATILNGINDRVVNCPLQSDGSAITCNIDDRYSYRPFIVGNLMYAVNNIGDGSVDDIHWMIINLLNQTVLQQGLIHDPNYFYTYPAIAANANGDFLIGFDRSGNTGNPATGNMEAWVAVCHFDGAIASCADPTEVGAGDSSLDRDLARMGDYNALEIDPNDPNTFWSSIEVPLNGHWSTQITELTLVPEPAAFGFLAVGVLALLLLRRRQARSQ